MMKASEDICVFIHANRQLCKRRAMICIKSLKISKRYYLVDFIVLQVN